MGGSLFWPFVAYVDRLAQLYRCFVFPRVHDNDGLLDVIII